METKYLVIGMAAIILLVSIVQSFQINSLKNQMTANVIQISNDIDITGWTEDEKMQYEHHGVLPARLQQNSKQTSQVGNC